MTIAVVHLVYMPFGIDCFKNFTVSYKTFEAGATHKLYIVFKGLSALQEIEVYKTWATETGLVFETLIYPNGGLDIDAYRWAAKEIKSDYLFFINTRSKLLATEWLRHLINAAQSNPRSVIGATGSYQSPFSSIYQKNTWLWENGKPFKHNFDKYKMFVKGGTLWRFYFKRFPNPHLRTNAFLIKRDLFLSLSFPVIKTKLDAYRFESGRNGFSAQLIKRGFALLLMDRFGKTYKTQNWPVSGTFWQGQQQNLLVSDNQTEMYSAAAENERAKLSFLAWGKGDFDYGLLSYQ